MSTATAPRARRGAGLTSTQIVYLVLALVVVVSAVLTAIQGRSFFSQGNIWAVLTSMSVLGLIAIGQTLVILAGSLDLSVPYVVSLATLVAADAMLGVDANLAPAVFNTLAIAALVGLVMGPDRHPARRARLHRQPGGGPDHQRLPRLDLPGEQRQVVARPQPAGAIRHRRDHSLVVPRHARLCRRGHRDAALHPAGPPPLRRRREPSGGPDVGPAHRDPGHRGPRAVLAAAASRA